LTIDLFREGLCQNTYKGPGATEFLRACISL
jgi:hypothetical protein